MKRISNAGISLMAALAFMAGLPNSALAGPVMAQQTSQPSASYLDEPVLLLKPADLRAGRLPASIHISGISLVLASDIKQACHAVHARENDALVFRPQTRTCLTLTTLLEQARSEHTASTRFLLLENDRKSWLAALDHEAYLLVKPKITWQSGRSQDGPAAALVCACPQPELIFIDGFETEI